MIRGFEAEPWRVSEPSGYLEKSFLCRRKSICKGFDVEPCLACLKNSKDASVAEAG